MEERLAAYRRKKEKEKQKEESLFNKFKSLLMSKTKEPQNADLPHDNKADAHTGHTAKQNQKDDPKAETDLKSAVRRKPHHVTNKQENFVVDRESAAQSESQIDGGSKVTKWILRLLKFLLWICLWGLFIELQFGAVFFAISLLLFAYFNTRTGPKENKPSAYSVFNKDCERIGGTLTAEQLQKQMFSVPGLPS